MESGARPSATFSTADGRELRIYAVGDIHGRLDLLDDLIHRIGADVSARPDISTRIIILGDFIDRGPASAKIIELLIQLKTDPHVIVLRGNHETTMLDALGGNHSAMDLWLEHGGLATLESFHADLTKVETDDSRAMIKLARRVIPRRVIVWLRRLPTYIQFGQYYFVHAGIRPGVLLQDQCDEDRLWVRDDFTNNSDDHGAIIVHGHTIYENGIFFGRNRIGVDTGAYRTGLLSAVALQGDQCWIVDTSDQAKA
jgi:serine/threonine protein phosphatase 1